MTSAIEPNTMKFGGRPGSKAKRRGFTLTELMIVVAMIGVLSAIAIVGYRRYMRSAGTAEVKAVIQGIRLAQEAYKSETFVYLDVSPSLTSWYPKNPSDKKSHWINESGPGYANWRDLNVITDGPVKFGYAVKAGISQPGQGVLSPSFPCDNWTSAHANVDGPWFVVQAAGDQDNDQDLSYFASSSAYGTICVDKTVGEDE
jgi:type IV pilus assembly protein PilA